MKLNFPLLSLVFVVLILSGCATTQPKFRVNVDSIGSSSENKKSYVLLPGNKDTKVDDLQFKEYASYVNRVLLQHGFALAENFENANVAIFLGYGIGEPQERQYSYSIPTWGETGVSSSSTTGTVSSSYGGYGSYSGTTTYTPTYGVTGATTHTGSYTTYFRFMFLDAVDLEEYKKSKKEIQLWKTTVTSTGYSSDLRRVFPVLVAASKKHIATNTGKKITIELFEVDAQVLEIKDIVREPKR